MEYKFNENTRVQVPAAMHLCRLFRIYLFGQYNRNMTVNKYSDGCVLRSVQRLNPALRITGKTIAE